MKMNESVTVEGVTYVTVEAALASYGTHPRTFEFRLKRGWSVEDAITAPALRAPGGAQPLIIDGIHYRSLRHAAKAHGLETTLFRRRWRQHEAGELTLAEVLKKPRSQPRNPRTRHARLGAVELFGLRFRTVNAACVYYDITGSSALGEVYERLRAGVEPEKVFAQARTLGIRTGLLDRRGRRVSLEELKPTHHPKEVTR